MNSDTFPDRLKVVIKDRSLRTFGRLCGLSEGALRKYLSGQSEPGMSALIAISKAGGVDVNWLATGEGYMRGGEGGIVEEGGYGYHPGGPLVGADLDVEKLIGAAEAIQEVLQHSGRLNRPRGAPGIDIVSEKILTMLMDMPEEKRRDVLKYAEDQKRLADLDASESEGEKKRGGKGAA